MITLDSTTLTAYQAATTLYAKNQVIINALADPVTIKVYDGSNNVKGTGTMKTPWATIVDHQFVVNDVVSFSVTAAGTPDANWYLRFESGSRWIRGSFGLAGSGQDFLWSKDGWNEGSTGQMDNVLLGVAGNATPRFSGAPSQITFVAGVGGTEDFSAHVVDNDGDPLTYTLTNTPYTGVYLTEAGVLTVTPAASVGTYSLSLRVSDNLSSQVWPCTLNIVSSNYAPVWQSLPTWYIQTGTGGTFDVRPYVTDPEGQPVTISLVSPPAGYSILNGIITATASAQSASLTLSAFDGSLSSTSPPLIVVSASVDLQAARDAGYIVVTDYKTAPYIVDNTGVNDSTAGLQKAIDDAFNGYKSIYVPSGEYRLNDTLRFYHWNNVIRDEKRTHFIQGCSTNPPVFKLTTGASGFTNAADPRPVICVRAWNRLTNDVTLSPYDAQPSHPFGVPSGFEDESGMVVATRIHSIVVDTNDNAGAIGMVWSVAQRGNAAQIKVIAENSFAGFCGPGGTHGVSNLEVIGGRYGIYIPKIREADFQSGAYNSSIKLTGQTVANIAIGDFSPIVFIGCYFEMPPNGSVIKEITSATYPFVTSGEGTRQCTPVFIDCVVKATTDSVAFPVNDNTIYLRNVYVTGTTKLIQATSTSSVITATGTWKRIDEYSRGGGPCEGNVDGSYRTYPRDSINLPHRTLIDGTLSGTLQAEVSSITANSDSPSSLTVFVDRHAHPLLPCIDNGPYCDVTKAPFNAPVFKYGAYRAGDMFFKGYQSTLQYGDYVGNLTGNRPVDAAPAINAAIAAAELAGHNRVFLPRGVFYISSPVYLKKNTQLFGLGAEKSNIAPMWDWEPTSTTNAYMVISADDAEGTASMSDLQIYIRKEWGNKFEAPNLGSLPGLYVKDNVGATCYLYPYDYFCEVKWRTGRNSWTHGVLTSTQWVDEYWPAKDRQKWTFTGNGGGRHWHIFADGRSNCASGYRLVLAINTTQPLSFYALNGEAGKGVLKDYGYDVQANVELRGASNVRLYGSKREGNGATLWINGNTNPCNNVACYGPGVQMRHPYASGNPYGDNEATYLAVTGDVSNALIAVSTVQKTDIDVPIQSSIRLMLKEAITGQTVKKLYWPVGVALYKRGTIDDSVMFNGETLWNGDFSTGNFTQYPNNETALDNVGMLFCPPFGTPKKINLPAGKTYSYRSGSWTMGGQSYSWDGAEGDGSNIDLVRTSAAPVTAYAVGATRGASLYAARFRAKSSVASGGTGVEPRDGDIVTTDLGRRRTQLQCIKPIVKVYSPNVHLKTRWYSVSIFNPSNQPSLLDNDWGPTHFNLIKIVQRPGGMFSIRRHPASGGWELTTDHDQDQLANYTESDPLSEWWETCKYNPNTGLTEYSELVPDFPNATNSRAALNDENLGGWTDFVIKILFDYRETGVGTLDVWMRKGSSAAFEVAPKPSWVHVLAQRPKSLVRDGTHTLKRGIGFNFLNGNNGGGVGIDAGIYVAKDNVWTMARDFDVVLSNLKVGDENTKFEDMTPEGNEPTAELAFRTSFTGVTLGNLVEGGRRYITGTDTVTGFTYPPQLWTPDDSPVSHVQVIDYGSAADNSDDNCTLEIEAGTGYSGNNALRFLSTKTYTSSAQTNYQVTCVPDSQGLVYNRFYIKLDAGWWAKVAGNFAVLMEAKRDDQYDATAGRTAAWRIGFNMLNDSNTPVIQCRCDISTNTLLSLPQPASSQKVGALPTDPLISGLGVRAPIGEGVWTLVETAIKFDLTEGIIWLAIGGVERFAYRGPTLYSDARCGTHCNRYFPFKFYSDGPRSVGSPMGMRISDWELWQDNWPSTASLRTIPL